MGYMHGEGMMGGSGAMLLGWVFMLLFLVGLVLIIIWLYNQITNQQTTTHPERAIDILKMRYAKGEIDKKEFEEKKKDL